MSFLHAALEYAVENDIIPKNPCPLFKRRYSKAENNDTNYLPVRYFGDFYEAIKKDVYCHFFLLLLLTGLRLSEGFGLRDYDLDNTYFTVSHQLQRLINLDLLKKFKYTIVYDKLRMIKGTMHRIVYVLRPTKGRKRRTIDYTPFCKQLLWEAREHMAGIPMAHKNKERLLFVNDDGGHYRKATLSTHLKKCLTDYRDKTGIDLTNITLHTLRHTYATWINDEGGDVQSLSRVLGHSSPETTKHFYIHETKEARRTYNGHALNIDDMICRTVRKLDIGNSDIDDSDEDFEDDED